MIDHLKNIFDNEPEILYLMNLKNELWACQTSLEDSNDTISQLEESTGSWLYKLLNPEKYQRDMQNLKEWEQNKKNCEQRANELQQLIENKRKTLSSTGVSEQVLNLSSSAFDVSDLENYVLALSEELESLETILDIQSLIESYPNSSLVNVSRDVMQQYVDYISTQDSPKTSQAEEQFFGKIDFLGSGKNGITVIGETILYRSQNEYENEIHDSRDCGRPISFKRISEEEYAQISSSSDCVWLHEEDNEQEL